MNPFDALRGLSRIVLLAIGLLVLTAFSIGRACADTLFLTEFRGSPPNSVYYQAVTAPAQTSQTVAIAGASAQSSPFGVTTGIIRVHVDINCRVVIGGTSPTATASSMRMIAGQTEYFVVKPGERLAVISGT
jgi:hypothetical protein